jgi:hypothetical protein
LPGAVGVRDSKVPGGQALVFTTAAWRAFAGQVKSGNPVNRTISKADLTR